METFEEWFNKDCFDVTSERTKVCMQTAYSRGEMNIVNLFDAILPRTLSDEEEVDWIANRINTFIKRMIWNPIGKPPTDGSKVLLTNKSKEIWVIKSFVKRDGTCATHWMYSPSSPWSLKENG